MTIWIDDGSDEGFYANCENCPFAVEEHGEADYVCGFAPPVAMRTPDSIGMPAGIPAWSQPLVRRNMHCHNHPALQRAFHDRLGPDWPDRIKRPEDVTAEHCRTDQDE